jgi:membrane-bound metal-dependent hydrolase YbcI (DUF457 family)
MASPVAHSFAGFWTFLILIGRYRNRTARWLERSCQLCMLVFVANLADLDFLPELFFHRDIHRGPSHALLAAVLAGIVFAGIWRIAGTFWASACVYFVAYASHLLIDFFTGGYLGWNHSASGIPLFWPWPGARVNVASLLVLDYGVRHGSLSALFSPANLRAVCYDLSVYGTITILLLLWWARYVLKKPGSSSASDSSSCLLPAESAPQQ